MNILGGRIGPGSQRSGTGPALPRWLGIFQSPLNVIERGTVEVALPDGKRYRFSGCEPGPRGQITVLNPRFFQRLLAESDLAFGEMFMDRWWTTPDLQNLLDVIVLNSETLARRFPGAGLFRLRERLRHFLNANSRKGSRRNIAHHYDLGNAFYGVWLDGSMTYSSALFRSETESLDQAQLNKYASICDRLALSPDDLILEIGCGWGGFAEYAARERGARLVGLTISREQRDYARRRLFEAGLAERVDIRLSDYRDEHGSYDGIASIEMIEAVGEKYWPAYFKTVRDQLRPSGRAVLQAITVADHRFSNYRTRTDFMQKHIFPGGMLPSPAVMQDRAGAAGLELDGTESFGDSYSSTLRAWRRRFNARWDRISALGFDGRFHRMWNYYLASSAACFASGATDVAQFLYRRLS